MKNQLRKVQLLSVFLLCTSQGWAQNDADKRDYKKNPYWVEMMDDSTVNYFEAKKAFQEFWLDRKPPVEDDVAEGNKKQEWTRLRRILNNKEYKEEQETEAYRFEYKKFKHWQLMVEPYVQADGRILSTQEQLEIWKKQRQ